eukprot:SAG31_NODE_1343_length_8700_cov_1.967911_5_plen_47_part_00
MTPSFGQSFTRLALCVYGIAPHSQFISVLTHVVVVVVVVVVVAVVF